MVAHSQVRFVGIDYSGAKTPTSSLRGLRVFQATDDGPALEVPPPPSARKYWTRRGVAEWLAAILADGRQTLVGIDHGFSFPTDYFERFGVPKAWDAFLDDFCAHWPTDEDNTYVCFVRDGRCGHAGARTGDSRWRRMGEVRARAAKSVFHFDVQGQVATSTHAGIPWLRKLRWELPNQVHFWPFDGWNPPPGSSVIAEVYPSLWKNQYAVIPHFSPDQHDAHVVSRWLQDHFRNREISAFFAPTLTPKETQTARYEGWILGVR